MHSSGIVVDQEENVRMYKRFFKLKLTDVHLLMTLIIMTTLLNWK
jgi:hypothetical protein